MTPAESNQLKNLLTKLYSELDCSYSLVITGPDDSINIRTYDADTGKLKKQVNCTSLSDGISLITKF